MDWMTRLENRFGRFAIPHLIRAIAILNGSVYLLFLVDPKSLEWLMLLPDRVYAGEIWRLVTFLFIPQFGGIMPGWMGAAFYIYYLIWLGDALEEAMGAFRVNLFYLFGVLGCIIAALITGSGFSGALLNGSLFLAFARFYPELMIYIFFVLPVKVKWLAWLTAAGMLFGFVTGPDSYRLALVATMLNYLLFFGRDIYEQARMRRDVTVRRRRFDEARHTESEPMHQCAVCRRTDATNPELEFRVSRDGNEYCMEHRPG